MVVHGCRRVALAVVACQALTTGKPLKPCPPKLSTHNFSPLIAAGLAVFNYERAEMNNGIPLRLRRARHRLEARSHALAMNLQRFSLSRSRRPLGFTRIQDVSGTWLQGGIATTFVQIEKHFGVYDFSIEAPASWGVRFDDGTIACIYVYKTDMVPANLHLWHIGGLSSMAVERVAEVLRRPYYLRRKQSQLTEEHMIDI